MSLIPISFAHRILELMTRHKPTHTVRCLSLPSGGKEIKLYSNRRNDYRLRYGVPRIWYKELQNFEFENCLFLGTKHYDAYLTSRYGNYMKLPSKEKRIAKDPAIEWEF